MSRALAAIIGGAAGAIGVLGLAVAFVWFCILHQRSASRTSGTGSSDPSLQEQNVGLELSLRGGVLASESRGGRQFSLDELVSATKDFSDKNLIGFGSFGEVFKGLLADGRIVAVKKREGAFIQKLREEVHYLSSIRHRHVVSLLGYCMEDNQQMLVYEYVPGGSAKTTNGKLEFKHRLSIALGAAKGLAYLHAMNPPLLHKDFRTINVLVDENYVAKVADAGLQDLLSKIDAAGPSSQTPEYDDVFHDPEYRSSAEQLSEKSDVYGFGVFLLELMSGKEATTMLVPNSDRNMVEWMQNYQELSETSVIIDQKIVGNFTTESMKDVLVLIMRCVNLSSEARPSMGSVVSELDRILEKEIAMTTLKGESAPIVTLGSQLFGPR